MKGIFNITNSLKRYTSVNYFENKICCGLSINIITLTEPFCLIIAVEIEISYSEANDGFCVCLLYVLVHRTSVGKYSVTE